MFSPSGCGAPPGYLCFRRQVVVPHRGVFVFAVRLWCSTGVSLFPPSGCGAPPGYLCFRRQVVVLHRGIFVYAVASACLLLVIFSRRDVARLRRADAYGCTKVPRWDKLQNLRRTKAVPFGNHKIDNEKIFPLILYRHEQNTGTGV